VNKVYPEHVYEKVRYEVAISYLQHEFRKLFLNTPADFWEILDKDIAGWTNSPELTTPRDFWNGFHGISMGFKLKIGLIYYITAENIAWRRIKIPISDLWFGVEFNETRKIKEGKLSLKEVNEFYNRKKNNNLKGEWLRVVKEASGRTLPRDQHPIIVVQKKHKEFLIYSIFDGNRRSAKALLEGNEKIDAYVGEYIEGTSIKNYWIPTTILMELILFSKQAYDRGNKEMFQKYMEILKDILLKSDSAKYELKERSLTGSGEFKSNVLKALGL